MILTVAELRQYIETEETDAVLEMKLQALESAIQRYTNNDFKRCLTAEGEYPADIKKGIVDMMQWDLTHFGRSVRIQNLVETAQCLPISYWLVTNDRKTLDFRAFGTMQALIETSKCQKTLETQRFPGFFYTQNSVWTVRF